MKMKSRIVAAFDEDQVYEALWHKFPCRVAELERAFSLCINNVLPRAVLVLILRHCWRKTRTIMLVCRAWHSICTTEVDYWRLAYYDRLNDHLANVKPEMKRDFFKVFHTFYNEFFPSFIEKVGWLFGKNTARNIHRSLLIKNTSEKIKLFSIESHRFSIDYSFQNNTISMLLTEIDKKSKLFVEKLLHVNDSVVYGHFYAKQIDMDSAFYDEIEYFHKKDDLKWHGTGIQKYGIDVEFAQPIPSGDGTWSRLSTGEVLLSGKDVAHRGLMDDDGKTYHRGKRIKIENEG